MKGYVEKMIKEYPRMVREREALRKQIEEIEFLSAEDLISSMSFSHPEGERVQSSDLSDKTARIAMCYESRLDRINEELVAPKMKQLARIDEEIEFFEYCVRHLPMDVQEISIALFLDGYSWDEIEASYYFLPKDVKIITITGSNGKTTTTTMVYELLKHSSHTVHVGGNIGIPLSSFVEDIKPNDILVLEISDHQLCDMYHFKSDISVLTNLSETHIDFHGSYEIYKQTKKKIFNHHTEKDIAILNKSNIDVMNLTKDIEDQKIYFSSTEVADAYLKNNQIIYNGEAILDCKDIRVKGNHNYENIMVAIIIAKMFSITNEQIKDFFSKFVGVEHRIEYVKTVNGRQFYNDSKSTNNTATITALKSFKDPTILLMGGLDRNISFDEISHYLNHVKAIICFGETKYKLEEFAKKNHKEVFVVNTLTEATKKAYEISNQGDIILLSPACASWDQYSDFETRGNEFKTIINHL